MTRAPMGQEAGRKHSKWRMWERHSQGQPQGNGGDSDQPTANTSSTINYMVQRNGHIFSGLRIIVLELPKALFFFFSPLAVILVMTFDIPGLDLSQEQRIWR